MNPEKLHDALNLLEDDLILEVEHLREKKRTLRWQHFGALAACLAVVCVLGLYGSGLFDRAESGDAAQMEMAVENSHLDSDEAKNLLATEATCGYAPRDQAETANETESSDLMVPLPSAVVRIDHWQDNCFTCTVMEPGDTLSEGDSVTVLLTQDTHLALEKGQQTVPWTAGEQPFAEDALVELFYVSGPERDTVYGCIISLIE